MEALKTFGKDIAKDLNNILDESIKKHENNSENGVETKHADGKTSPNACAKEVMQEEAERNSNRNLDDSYPLIENHGAIGNMKTLAMVTTSGTIDWFCFPHFDSPSVFASLLDAEMGGSWEIYPAKSEHVNHTKQFYNAWTNILITRFSTDNGLAQITDYMPVHMEKEKRESMNFIVRKVCCQSGSMKFYVKIDPAFNYARDDHTISIRCKNKAIFKSPGLEMQMLTSLPISKLDIKKNEGKRKTEYIYKEFEIKENEHILFYLAPIDENHDGQDKAIDDEDYKIRKSFFTLENHVNLGEDTRTYWLKWIAKCTYKGRWNEMVNRSALVLKLLTYEKTGAIIAAGTCSVPEAIGEGRNWDYRYMWIRDAAFTLYAFMRIGFTEEAEHFMKFLEGIMKNSSKRSPEKIKELGPLQIMYKIDGSTEIPESTLDHLCGYKHSAPVRIGNGAFNQLQLDIYGELMDSIYLYNKYATPVTYDLWTSIKFIVDWVCDNWRRRDEGVWEVRASQQHFVYSKVMCWVAVDRALRLAERRSFPAPRTKWLETRDQIYEDILKNGWDEKNKHFTMYYGSDHLDASCLIMPLVFFMSPNDPRFIDTLESVLKPTSEGGLCKNSLVYRYDIQKADDGLMSEEGTFNICSFWLIEALTRVGRHFPDKMKDAHNKFDEAMSYSNHLGLYSEEISCVGKHVGNFPQAFSHIALISAAYNLNRDLKL